MATGVSPMQHASRPGRHGLSRTSSRYARGKAANCDHPVRLSGLPRDRTFWLSLPFLLAIRAYQIILGPVMGGHCRFYPTCSHYALNAYRLHGPIRGTWLTAWRLLRCQPLCRGGIDLVPVRRTGLERGDSAMHIAPESASTRPTHVA